MKKKISRAMCLFLSFLTVSLSMGNIVMAEEGYQGEDAQVVIDAADLSEGVELPVLDDVEVIYDETDEEEAAKTDEASVESTEDDGVVKDETEINDDDENISDEVLVDENNEVLEAVTAVETLVVEENADAEDADVVDEDLDEEEIEVEEVYEESVEEVVLGELAGSTTEVEDYLDYKVDSELYPVYNAASTSGDNLNAYQRIFYNKLKFFIAEIAAGNQASTELTITYTELGYKQWWTAADLGLTSLDNGQGAEALREKLINEAGLYNAYQSLLSDCPYESYWMDSAVFSASFETKYIDGQYKISMPYITLKVIPKTFYKGTKDYTVDQKKMQAAAITATSVQTIIKDASSYDDLSKLAYYRDAICKLTDYNTAAAESVGSSKDGNAWAIIYVFDGDPNTKVVCEGYAKAFQYLCERTVFTDSSINCYTVTGYAKGGAHAWNIVHWKDGANYLVDVTFCDTTGTDKFFMIYPSSGNVTDGYTFGVNGLEYKYTYSYDVLNNGNYKTEQLKLNVVNAAKLTDIHINYNPDICVGDTAQFTVIRDGGSDKTQFKMDYAKTGSTDVNPAANASYGSRHVFDVTFNKSGNYELKFSAKDSDGKVVSKTINITVVSNGLTQFADGKWYYTKYGVVQTNYTGLVEKDGKWYYVQKGVLNWGLNTLVQHNGTWYYLSNSTVDDKFTGLVDYNNNKYYIQKGVLTWGVNGLVQHKGTWYYINNSTVDTKYTGLVAYNNKWYYVQKGVLTWGVKTLVQNNGVWYYVNNSTYDSTYTGLVSFNGKWYYVQKGVLNWGVKTLVQYEGTWYYVSNSTLDWNYTGIVPYNGTDYYVQKGSIKWGVNGLTNVGGTWYYLSNSAVRKGYTGLVEYNGTWYYVQKGVLNWGVKTLVLYGNTWYYVSNSKIDWNYTGIVPYNGTDYYVQKGSIKWGVNGLTNVGGTWYNLSNSAVKKSYTGLVQYNGTWYYVQNGVLKWGERTLAYYGETWYYVNNSTLDWNYTGLVEYNNNLYYVQKGVLKWGYNGTVEYNGKKYTVVNSTAKK